MTVSTYSDIARLAAREHLDILGGFHPTPDDKTPATCKTLLLLGPGQGFWPHIQTAQEMQDGKPDPIDRWSTRILTALADDLNADPRFPFGGPPYEPFYTWALRTGRIWSSPVKLAVHDRHGLFVSFRGALLLPETLDLPNPPQDAPCATCTKPCLTACPVEALTDQGYALATCHSHLDSATQTCMSQGCAVRRACPVGQTLRDPAQSRYHMSVFHRSQNL